MEKINKKPPKKSTEKDNFEQRKKDIEQALMLPVNQGAEFRTFNIKSWRSSFYQRLRELESDAEFTIRKVKDKNNYFNIWRIK